MNRFCKSLSASVLVWASAGWSAPVAMSLAEPLGPPKPTQEGPTLQPTASVASAQDGIMVTNGEVGFYTHGQLLKNIALGKREGVVQVPGGRYVAVYNDQTKVVYGDHGIIKIYDLEGHLVREYAYEGRPDALTANGEILITISGGFAQCQFRIYDAQGHLVKNVPTLPMFVLHPVRSEFYVVGNSSFSITTLPDLRGRKEVKLKRPVEIWVGTTITFSPSGRRLAVTNVQGGASFYTDEGEFLSEWEGTLDALRDAVIYSADENTAIIEHRQILGEFPSRTFKTTARSHVDIKTGKTLKKETVSP